MTCRRVRTSTVTQGRDGHTERDSNCTTSLVPVEQTFAFNIVTFQRTGYINPDHQPTNWFFKLVPLFSILSCVCRNKTTPSFRKRVSLTTSFKMKRQNAFDVIIKGHRQNYFFSLGFHENFVKLTSQEDLNMFEREKKKWQQSRCGVSCSKNH